jgi:uncharacterized phage protein (TIGR02218 family)
VPLISLPAPHQEIAASDVQRPVVCYLIVRQDGVTLPIANFSRPIPWNGWLFLPADGAQESAVEQEGGLGATSLDLNGVVSDSAIKEEDLAAGRYDDSTIYRYLFDWGAPWVGPLRTDVFDISEIQHSGDRWNAQAVGLAARLERRVGEEAQPECTLQLGDPVTCRADPGPQSVFLRQVTAVDSASPFRKFTLSMPAGTFFANRLSFGTLTVRSGPNRCLSRKVFQHLDPGSITLWTKLPHPMEVGDVVDVRAGCKRDFVTCKNQYSNHINFPGRDRIPGTDEVLQPATA